MRIVILNQWCFYGVKDLTSNLKHLRGLGILYKTQSCENFLPLQPLASRQPIYALKNLNSLIHHAFRWGLIFTPKPPYSWRPNRPPESPKCLPTPPSLTFLRNNSTLFASTKFRIFFQLPYAPTLLFSHSSQNCRGALREPPFSIFTFRVSNAPGGGLRFSNFDFRVSNP